jgi:protection of telomeres protein 1
LDQRLTWFEPPDWKCTLAIFDKSTEDDGAELKVNIFRPEDKLPQADAGDVVFISSAKISSWDGQLALLTHRSTHISVFSASAIPRPPQSAADALRRNPSTGRPLTEKECEYVSWLYHATDKYQLPDVVEFRANKERSLNIKEKFRTLADVRDGQFCDLIVQVVRDPWDQGDKVTLWVTDYTENDSFFKFSWDGSDMPVGRDGDPFGYIPPNNAAVSRSWPGPFGKRSLQLTCYEPHASRLRDETKAGDWTKLRNIHIKFGHNGHNLEGFLREDRNTYGSRNSFEILDISGGHDAEDRLKDAVRRKRDYEKTAKQQKKAYAVKHDAKRKADPGDDTKQNSRARRGAKRAAINKEVVQQEAKKEAMLGLNENIKCESIEQPVCPLAKVLESVPYHTTVDGEQVEIILPYTNVKYRTTVRVVDYRPRKLEDFAVWRKVTEFDMLSDCSGGADSESDNDDEGTLDRFTGEKVWEWRFALLLEEAGHKAGAKGPPERLWAMVSNFEGQQLTKRDACE